MTAEKDTHIVHAVSRTKLTSKDRCDGCSARAKHVVVLLSGGKLYLCGHHTDRSRDALESQGATIYTPNIN